MLVRPGQDCTILLLKIAYDQARFPCFSGWAWAVFFCVRFAERLLPQRILRLSLWPAAAVWGLAEIRKRRRARAAWQRLSKTAAFPSPASRRLWQAVGAHHARFVYLFPDRLPERRWLKRCRLVGASDPIQWPQRERRIVFASLHFGPFETLPYWLRAHGLAVTVLVGRPAPRQKLKQRQYALSPPSGVPVVLPVTEMGRIREAVSQVRHLLVMMDVNRGRQIEVPFEQLVFRLATGAIRIAALTDADLIPCLTTVAGGWRFTIHFGAPVPPRYLGSAPDIPGAALHLLKEFMFVVRQDPAQCGYRFLSCIRAAESVPGDYGAE